MNFATPTPRILIVLLLGLVGSWTSPLLGQGAPAPTTEPTDRGLILVSRPYGDAIKLRWAPTNYRLWQLGNEYGYQLTRTQITKGGQALTPQERINAKQVIAENLKPLPAEEWRELVENDDMAFLAGGILYGEGFSIEPEIRGKFDAVGAYEAERSKEYEYAYCMYAAEHSFTAAQALGVGWVDQNVQPQDGYFYEITFMPNAPVEEDYRVRILVADNQAKPLPQPQYFEVRFGDQQVGLRWNSDMHKQIYSSYQVERSTDGGQSFTVVNRTPVVQMVSSDLSQMLVYRDSLDNNTQTYAYRVRGKTPFGDWGPYTEVLEGKGRPAPIPAVAQITGVTEFPKGMMQLRWQFDSAYVDQIKGFDLYRSNSRKEEFVKLNEAPLSAQEWVYTDQTPLTAAYYKVVVVDINDHEIQSFPVLAQLEDLVAPSAPVGLMGELDPETGIVQLSWTPNTEEDLKGYRVFRAHDENDPYVQLTKRPLYDTVFTDTIGMQVTNEKVFYKVLAYDHRENFSFKSEACVVSRPDKFPPSAPVFTQHRATVEGVELGWASSSSSDVVLHELQRRVVGSEAWDVIWSETTSASLVDYIDSTASKRQEYQYRVMAFDDADNTSVTKVIISKPIDNHVREGIQDLSAEPLRRSRVVQVSWNYDAVQAVREFVVYRAKKNQSISTYRVIESEQVRIAGPDQVTMDGKIFFEDRNVERGQEYTYQILAKHKDGGFSPLTEPVVARF